MRLSSKMRGFTLIELTIYIALSSFVILSSGQMLKSILDYQEDLQQRNVWVENSSRALKDIGFVVREGTGFEILNGGAGLKVILSEGEVVYSLASGRLQKQVGAETPYFVTGSDSTLSTLGFEDVGGGVVKAAIAFESGVYSEEGFFFPRNQE